MAPRSLQQAAWWLVVALGTIASARSAHADPTGSTTWFMHAADPQIGYGEAGRDSDAARFERLLAHAAAKGAAFVVVAGDLVQDRTWLQWRAFEHARATAKLPVYYVAGNHDVVDSASLASYRDRMGKDYYVVERAGVTLIVVNSETARDTRIDEDESREQWAWLETTLGQRRCDSSALCVVAMHRPPFVIQANEEDTEQNWPRATRYRLLELLMRSRVRTVLAGHLHITHEVRDAVWNVSIYSVGGTARVFDEAGAGYREMRVVNGALGPSNALGPNNAQSRALEQRYVALERFPAPPPDFMGVPGWTPRVFQPSLRHWLLTLGECAAGLLALAAASAFRRAGAVLPKWSAVLLWRGIGAGFLFVGVNEQLDIDELAVALLRQLARGQGWFDLRHQTGAAVAGLCVLVAVLSLIWTLARAGRARRFAWGALLAVAVPTAFFVLSTLSDHGFGMLLSLDTWDVLLFLALPLGVWSCLRARNQAIALSIARAQASDRPLRARLR